MSFETAPNRDDRLTPQLIAALEFSGHLRGYNRDEVRAFLVKVAAQMSSLEEALNLSRAEIEVLKRDSGSHLQIGDIEASKVGEHAAEVVRIASDTARALSGCVRFIITCSSLETVAVFSAANCRRRCSRSSSGRVDPTPARECSMFSGSRASSNCAT